MKNKIYILGIVCISLIIIGSICKIQHWPGAGIMISIAFPLFAAVFMPMALINSYKAEADKKQRMLYIIAFICAFVDIIGALFKLQHWPGAGILVTIGLPLPFILFLPAYILYVGKIKNLNYNNVLLVLFFFAYFGAITAFLALNISKTVIDEYVLAANNDEQEAKLARERSMLVLEQVTSGNAKDSLDRKNILTIQEKAGEVCALIDLLKLKLSAVMVNDPQFTQFDIKNNQMNLWNICGKDMKLNYRDIINVNELKDSLNSYRSILLSIKNIDSPMTHGYISKLISTDSNWEENTFGGKRMIAIIERLNFIKRNVNLAELEAVSAIAENI